MFDREDFDRQIKEQTTKKAETRKPLLHQLIAVAPMMEALTQSDDWNRYLSYLQARIEISRKAKDAADQILHDPQVTGHEDLLRAKIAYSMALAHEKAFTEALEIPKQIIESGKSAEELLGKLDAD